jgi:Homeodomain-like domain
MPWNETNAMRERIRFIHEWEKGDLTALVDLPRTPHHHPWTTDALMVDLIIRARRQQPTWGPRKLRERLRRAYPQIDLPAPITIGAILKGADRLDPSQVRPTQGLTLTGNMLVGCVGGEADLRVLPPQQMGRCTIRVGTALAGEPVLLQPIDERSGGAVSGRWPTAAR